MLDFAVKVCLESQKTSAQDFEVLHGHGFSNDDIWDIGRNRGVLCTVESYGERY